MKKIFKSKTIIFILSVIIFSGFGTAFAYSLLAPDVGFTPRDEKWEVDNVKDALDDLRDKLNNVEFVDLTYKTTANNSCYNLDRVTAVIDRVHYEMFLRVQATKVIEDCNTQYTVDISGLNFSNITYSRNLDLGNSSIYRFSNITTNTNTLSFHVDTNYGYGVKQNYNYLVYYTYT